MRKYGYIRVSTTGQARYGNSLADQMERLIAAGVSPDDVYVDTYTGTTMDRPELDKLLALLQPGDEVIVCKLDRLARTAADGSKLVRDLVDRGITVNILNMGKADNTPMGRLMVTILLAFAEYERDMIVERTQAGKDVARKKEGYREGRPAKQIPPEALRMIADGVPKAVVARRYGISRSTLYKAIGGMCDGCPETAPPGREAGPDELR